LQTSRGLTETDFEWNLFDRRPIGHRRVDDGGEDFVGIHHRRKLNQKFVGEFCEFRAKSDQAGKNKKSGAEGTAPLSRLESFFVKGTN